MDKKDRAPSLAQDHKSLELKKRLLECIDREAKQFSESTRSYFEKESLSEEDKVGLLNAVIAAVDHVLTAEDWTSSLFLRTLIKPLVAIREEAEAELHHYHIKTGEKAHTVAPSAEDEIEVYISLFQSDGYDMGKWALQLRALSRYVVGRPIYQNEADVLRWMQLRAFSPTEAYVAVIVKKRDIQTDPQRGQLKDRYDHPLFQLKETATQHGRVVAFVHQGVRYYFVDGELVKYGVVDK